MSEFRCAPTAGCLCEAFSERDKFSPDTVACSDYDDEYCYDLEILGGISLFLYLVLLPVAVVFALVAPLVVDSVEALLLLAGVENN